MPGEDPALLDLTGEVGRRGLPFHDLVHACPGCLGTTPQFLVLARVPQLPRCPRLSGVMVERPE
ncbi:hypothetical protein ADL25_32425 [Streptomyces sp. NRRL F-5122]|nr:hypothetical protein ADL25_32425 [Streptomyces sp. NRRL F-5122]